MNKSPNQGKSYYTKGNAELFLDEGLSQAIGQLETAVPVAFVQAGKNADLVELTMWRKEKGFGRIWYHDFGKKHYRCGSNQRVYGKSAEI
ncbi:trimethylamine-N-oxide reductase c-type cytochrome TorC [Mannheimia haemolytica]|uniref:Trimethylamine-N-oxide reductase c-type cytochrome TorC n=1 Tax=Mannheimia haemolytica TaxID=75985 RepID=A0A378N2F7_MANHA|nr:trimethylamine-N-oxide reductase c-type cytochrome TorC [Mannheimia haemolytica]